MQNNKKLAFGLPTPGFGSPLKPFDINKKISRLSDKPKSMDFLQPEASARPPLRGSQKQEKVSTKTNQSKQKKGNKRKTNLGTGAYDNYTPYGLLDDYSSSSSSSDSFQGNETERVLGIVPNKRGEPVTFSYPGDIPLATMQLEDNYTPATVASLSTANFQSVMKLTWNLANYSVAFTRPSNDSQVSGHLDIIFERYSRMIIAKVRSGIISSWTLANFKSYLKAVCALLEAYYSVDSILAYEGSINEPDRNPVLINMKQQYSDFAIQVVHDKARSILKNCWFPESFSKLIRWTYQNYKVGTAYQCSNYRYFPDAMFMKTESAPFNAAKFITYYEGLISAVTGTTVDNRNITSLLANTIPDGIIGTLPDSCNRAVYDRQHHESYFNQGIAWYDGTDTDGWPTTTVNGYTLYGSTVNANEAGAFPFVLSTTYDTTLKVFKNGLLHPITANTRQDGTASNWYFRTNKFFANNTTLGSDNFNSLSRNLELISTQTPTGDLHTQSLNSVATSYGTAIGKACVSMCKHGQQNLYFNTSESRTLIIREFLNWLFYLA